ncbi:MAG: tRNA (adenosine(37)-N6)-threonylcarbamoyltransferase complex ATPase subunit type 1 TsaE [Gemmatimonadota bacterium]
MSPPRWRWRRRAPDAAAMRELGALVGRLAPERAVVLVEGPLGAGKTTFAQGVGAGCGVSEAITSPTYNLVLRYAGARPFTHADLYRLTGPDDLATLDPDALQPGVGVTCIEWPELVAPDVTLPRAAVTIAAAAGDGQRLVTGECVGDGWEALAAALTESAAT